MSGCEQDSEKRYCFLLLYRKPTEIKCFFLFLWKRRSDEFFSPCTYTDSAEIKTDCFLGM